MSDELNQKAFLEQLQERLARPMPTQIERELTLATSSEHLSASLVHLRAAVAAAQQAAGLAVEHSLSAAESTSTASPDVALAVQWASSVNDVSDALARADRDALATILAVRTLLQI